MCVCRQNIGAFLVVLHSHFNELLICIFTLLRCFQPPEADINIGKLQHIPRTGTVCLDRHQDLIAFTGCVSDIQCIDILSVTVRIVIVLELYDAFGNTVRNAFFVTADQTEFAGNIIQIRKCQDAGGICIVLFPRTFQRHCAETAGCLCYIIEAIRCRIIGFSTAHEPDLIVVLRRQCNQRELAGHFKFKIEFLAGVEHIVKMLLSLCVKLILDFDTAG